ncbi:MAG: glycosyl hydrolase [Pedobacter sp.]|nr:MAG: glycosyl hydrolase [Pedobacter sp.]
MIQACRKLQVIFLLVMTGFPGFAQLKETTEITRRVANYIVKNTSYRFIDVKTKVDYTSLEGLAENADVKAQSIYNKWEYSNGVMAIGMMELTKTLNDSDYHHYVRKNFEFVFNHLSFFEKQYLVNPKTEFYNLIRMNRLDDMGALSAALTRFNDNNTLFSSYLNKSINYITKTQLRLRDGTLCRPEPRSMTLWADDLYMSVPFLSSYGKINNARKYTDDAIRQVLNFNKYLFNAATGLYYHNWYSAEQSNGVAHWLRCNGWIAMAQVELLSQLDSTHPKRIELIGLLQRQIIGFARFQDTTGLWRQLIDKPDSYLETSGSAMFIYTVAKAVNEGWLPTSYLAIAEDGWKGLMKKVTTEGQLMDVCIGTGMRENLKFYYDRPTKLNDIHGAGAFLLAGSEMIKAYRRRSNN